MDKVFIKTKFNDKHLRGFFYFHMFRKSHSVYFYVVAAAVSLYLAISYSTSGEYSPSSTTMFWAVAVMAMTALPMFTFGRINSIIRYQKKVRKDGFELIELTKAKIVRYADGAENKVIFGWENFESAYEVKDCFYLYVDKERGLVLSKNHIVEGNLATLRKLISNNMGTNKKGRPKFKRIYKGE